MYVNTCRHTHAQNCTLSHTHTRTDTHIHTHTHTQRHTQKEKHTHTLNQGCWVGCIYVGADRCQDIGDVQRRISQSCPVRITMTTKMTGTDDNNSWRKKKTDVAEHENTNFLPSITSTTSRLNCLLFRCEAEWSRFGSHALCYIHSFCCVISKIRCWSGARFFMTEVWRFWL